MIKSLLMLMLSHPEDANPKKILDYVDLHDVEFQIDKHITELLFIQQNVRERIEMQANCQVIPITKKKR